MVCAFLIVLPLEVAARLMGVGLTLADAVMPRPDDEGYLFNHISRVTSPRLMARTTAILSSGGGWRPEMQDAGTGRHLPVTGSKVPRLDRDGGGAS